MRAASADFLGDESSTPAQQPVALFATTTIVAAMMAGIKK